MAQAKRQIDEAGEYPEADRVLDFPHPRERAVLIGQQAGEQVLIEALNSGRLHHAWLLGGPQGIGKASLAYRFARILLKNTDRKSIDSLEMPKDDHIFRQVAAQAHPDLIALRRGFDPKTKRIQTRLGIAQVRAAKVFLSKTASIDRGARICIVDSVDDMTLAAANALLKMLEEPPTNAVFLLVSHAPGRLLATIRSRCRRLDLNPLENKDIFAILEELGAGDMPANKAQKLAIIAEGSAARALLLVQNKGFELYQELLAIFESLPQLDLINAHKLAERLGARKPQAADEFKLFAELLCALLARLARGAIDNTSLADDREKALAANLAPPKASALWAGLWAEISHSLERANTLNLDRKQVVLTSLFALEDALQKRKSS